MMSRIAHSLHRYASDQFIGALVQPFVWSNRAAAFAPKSQGLGFPLERLGPLGILDVLPYAAESGLPPAAILALDTGYHSPFTEAHPAVPSLPVGALPAV